MIRAIIAGGGLAGCLAALSLARRRPEIEVLLVEQGRVFGGEHTWSWFDTDVPQDHCWILDGISQWHWPDQEVRFPRRKRIVPIGYNSIRSTDLNKAVQAELGPDRCKLNSPIAELGPNQVLLESGERLAGDTVIDARGPGAMEGQTLGWQKFVGRVYRFPRDHKVVRPVIMDATVPQYDGYRFLYLLPLSDNKLLVEDTYYSPDPLLDRAALGTRIQAAAEEFDAGSPETLYEESGVLPVLIDGDFNALWPSSDPIPRIGVRGGFFHPTTSYSLPDAVANAALLADQNDYSPSALASVLRKRAALKWQERRFFQFLNRMMFRAAEPEEMYRVLEHFYRLPTALIARFYGARLTRLDKLRILSGKPPVPLRRALSAVMATRP